MSLKAFHILFIVLSLLLAVFFGLWCITSYQQAQDSFLLNAGILSLIASSALVLYLVWFFKKTERMGYLALLFALPGLCVSRTAAACPVCFVNPNSALTRGAGNGILFLFLVILVIQGALLTLFLFWRARSRRGQMERVTQH